MRDIKFRYRLRNKKDNQHIIQCVPLFAEKNGLMQFPIDLSEWEVLSIDEWTGLLDKNNKEIYENDIVYSEDWSPSYFVIKFIEGGFCGTTSKSGIDDYPTDINIFYSSVGCSIEIVGDIYLNSNLITE